MDVDRSLRSSERNSYPFISLHHDHIYEAMERSDDNGATLSFSRMNLSDVGARAVEELITMKGETAEDESIVKRITLGGNHLTTLPTEFALLSGLRYLNLKHNNFLVFPNALTLMPSLDTLDISHNRIKKLPSQPGQLVQLRVFSLSRNKIARLPLYLSQFNNLEILQVDRNPIEWPPSSALHPIRNPDSSQSMKDWIRTLQKWLELDAFRGHSVSDTSHSEEYDQANNIHPWRNNVGNAPHIRSFSVDSNFSVSSVAESLQDTDTSSLKNITERPPPLRLGILRSHSAETSPTRSFESDLPSPAGSDPFSHGASTDSFHMDYHEPRLHTRNESYSGGLRNSNRIELRKKSMPDLRTAKLNFEELSSDLYEGDVLTDMHEGDHNNDGPQQDSNSSNGSDSVLSRSVISGGVLSGTSFERDAYFQRLSRLPTAIPLPRVAICLIDSGRGILFAVSQAYEALEQYAMNVADDRLSSILKRVLGPASADMMHLINALDRFDLTSRKAVPSPAACRAVVENCRNSVAVFGKAVAVLSLQLRVISTRNVRYSRWILLKFHAALVEISCTWQAMILHMDAIKTLLRSKAPSDSAQSPHSNPDFNTTKGSATPSPAPRPHPAGLNSADLSVSVGRVRTARRHAGSFSSKDVEIGKKLPSYDDVPGTTRSVVPGLATYKPTLRPPKRQATAPLSTPITISSSLFTSSVSLASTSSSLILPEDASATNHSRHESQGSLQTTASSSSPSAPSKANFLDLPFNSKTQVDREALQAVQAAVDIAPDVWEMIEETLGGIVEAAVTVRETLETARAVTARLSDTIRSMQSGDATSNRKSLREDAHVFLKTVVQLSNVIKTYGTPHTVSSMLRTKMVKLTNSTEEFAILLHVSSLPPAIPRSHSPMPGTLSSDENRLGFSLSRSRSAQPSASFKLPLQPRDGSRSAQPTQSFQIPVVRNTRVKETYDDLVDPG